MKRVFFVLPILIMVAGVVFSLPNKIPEVIITKETNNEQEADIEYARLKRDAMNKNWDFIEEDYCFNVNDVKESPMPVIAPKKVDRRYRFHIAYIEIKYMGTNFLGIYYIDTKNDVIWMSIGQ